MIVVYSFFGLAIVALALYLGFRRSDRIQYTLPDIPEIAIGDIDAIEIDSQSNGKVELRKRGGDWSIGPAGYKPDPKKIDKMLETITGLDLTDLVSTARYYERYELDEASRYTVVVSGKGNELFRFDVGKRAPTYNHTYVRVSGDDRVFQARGNLVDVFDDDDEALRDKLIFSIEPSSVTRIEATTLDASYNLYKSVQDEKAVWTGDDEAVWDTEKVESLLRTLSNLTSQRYIDDEDFGRPSFVLDVQGEESKQLFLFDKVDSGYRARSSQTPYPFILSTYQAERIIKTFEPEENES